MANLLSLAKWATVLLSICLANSSEHPPSAFSSLLLALNSGAVPQLSNFQRSHTRGVQLHAPERWTHPGFANTVFPKRVAKRTNPALLETAIANRNSPKKGQQPSVWFGDLKLPSSIASSLEAAGITAPLPIQAASSLAIARNKHTILHSETGSGKTLAYLLPLLSKLHVSRPCQLLIVVPSRELAVQTAAVVQQIWPHHGSQRAFVMVGTPPATETIEAMRKAASPVVIATPRSLLSLVRHLAGTDKTYSARAFKHSKDMIFLVKHLQAIVFDEVDALLLQRTSATAAPIRQDSSKFKEFKMPAAKAVQGILKAHSVEQGKRERQASFSSYSRSDKRNRRGSSQDNGLQVIACSASASHYLRQELGRLLDVRGESIHVITPDDAKTQEEEKAKAKKRKIGERGLGAVGIPQKITHTLVPCKNDEEKIEALPVVFSKAGVRHALLFLPDDAPLRSTVEQLRQKGLEAQMLHEALGFDAAGFANIDAYEALWKSMAEKDSTDISTTASSDLSLAGNATRVLVTTVSSARGLDLPDMDCVVLFSLPMHADEYLHVAGRTGRKGRTGAVFTFLRQDELNRVGKITATLGISMKPSSDIALALADARSSSAR